MLSYQKPLHHGYCTVTVRLSCRHGYVRSTVLNTGGLTTLHVRDKYFGGFAVNTKSGFASNEKVKVHTSILFWYVNV